MLLDYTFGYCLTIVFEACASHSDAEIVPTVPLATDHTAHRKAMKFHVS